MKLLLFLFAWLCIEIIDRLFRARIIKFFSNSNSNSDFLNIIDEPHFFAAVSER